MGPLPKPVMWITGASSGIGRALSLEAASRGYSLALTARRLELLQTLAEEIRHNFSNSIKVALAPADVTDETSLSSAHKIIKDTLGEVDILVANAGTHLPGDASEFSLANIRSLFDINFFGVLNCIDLVLPSMQKRSKGHIVGVSSVAGYRALPTAAAYGASKSALTYFLESLRFDLERFGVDVTIVSPGFVKTPLTDKNNFYMPCLIAPEQAARVMMDGIENKKFEIHFPLRFSLFLKTLRLLPNRTYHRLIAKVIKL